MVEIKNEIWKEVGVNPYYLVSNLGRVKSKARKVPCKIGFRNKKEHLLTPRENHNGYLYIGFLINGKLKNYFIHRLVAYAFLETPNDNTLQINHIDGNKYNNNVENLEWVTSSYNTIHSYKNGLQDKKILSIKQHNRIVSPEQVIYIKKEFAKIDTSVKGNKMKFYKEMQVKFGFKSYTAILNIVKNKTNRFFN